MIVLRNESLLTVTHPLDKILEGFSEFSWLKRNHKNIFIVLFIILK